MGNYGFDRQKLWFCYANGWVISWVSGFLHISSLSFSAFFLPVCSISPSPSLCLFFVSSDLFLSLTVATFFFFFFVSHLLREEMIASFHTGEKRNYRRGEKKKKKEKREKLRKKMWPSFAAKPKESLALDLDDEHGPRRKWLSIMTKRVLFLARRKEKKKTKRKRETARLKTGQYVDLEEKITSKSWTGRWRIDKARFSRRFCLLFSFFFFRVALPGGIEGPPSRHLSIRGYRDEFAIFQMAEINVINKSKKGERRKKKKIANVPDSMRRSLFTQVCLIWTSF